jgi:hypothetical protein
MDVMTLLLLQLLYDCCDVTTVMADTTTTTYYSSASTSISGMKNDITIIYRNSGSFNFSKPTTIENRFGSVCVL